MPLRSRIDEEADLVITTAEGHVSGEDLLAHARVLANMPNRPARELVDFSDRVEITVSTEAVRLMAHSLADHDVNIPGSRVAMVAKTDAMYGMMRVYQAHREHPNVTIRVFRDRDQAMKWLDGEFD